MLFVITTFSLRNTNHFFPFYFVTMSSDNVVIPVTDISKHQKPDNKEEKLHMRNTVLLSVAFGICFFGNL